MSSSKSTTSRDKMIEEMMTMGISRKKAVRALGGVHWASVEAAVNWLMDHPNNKQQQQDDDEEPKHTITNKAADTQTKQQSKEAFRRGFLMAQHERVGGEPGCAAHMLTQDIFQEIASLLKPTAVTMNKTNTRYTVGVWNVAHVPDQGGDWMTYVWRHTPPLFAATVYYGSNGWWRIYRKHDANHEEEEDAEKEEKLSEESKWIAIYSSSAQSVMPSAHHCPPALPTEVRPMMSSWTPVEEAGIGSHFDAFTAVKPIENVPRSSRGKATCFEEYGGTGTVSFDVDENETVVVHMIKANDEEIRFHQPQPDGTNLVTFMGELTTPANTPLKSVF